MEQVRSGPTGSITLVWDPETRVAVLTYHEPTYATGTHVHKLVEAMNAWVGDRRETFYLLNDCGLLIHMDAEYRALWWDFFRAHRENSWVALYNLSPVITVVAEMYRIATGLRIRVFKTEEQARTWLRHVGATA